MTKVNLSELETFVSFVKTTDEYNNYQEYNNILDVTLSKDILLMDFDKQTKKHTFATEKNRDSLGELQFLNLSDNSVNKLIKILVRLKLANIVEKQFTSRGRDIKYYSIEPSPELSHQFFKQSDTLKGFKEHNNSVISLLQYYNGEQNDQMKFVIPINEIEYTVKDEEETVDL